MTLQTLDMQTRETPRFSIIVMHGLGSSSDDLAPLCQALDLRPVVERVGGLRFVLPDAPVIPVTINNGMAMPAWYDIRHGDLRQREDAEGLRQSQALIEELIQREEQEHGIPPERVVLAGFSQGCAMTLLTGLRHARPLAGLVGLSGYLPMLDSTEAERHAANANTPVFLAHGDHDPVVPPARALAALAELQRLNQPVSWQTYPMGHEVCQEEVSDLTQWLCELLVKIG